MAPSADLTKKMLEDLYDAGYAAGYRKHQEEMGPLMLKLNEILIQPTKEEKPWSPVPDAMDV